MKISYKNILSFILAVFVFAVLKKLYTLKNDQRPAFVLDYKNNLFLKDGVNFDFISGSLHYFRVPHQLWLDRLLKLRASGINVVSTYVAWNIHEPHKGQFNFDGDADIIKFIKIAHSVGLFVNIRPGPYICAEWDLGGIPYFVLGTPDNPVKLRTMDPKYLKFVDAYFAKLLPMLQPLLYENGGPIILVQIENEYGSYKACDKDYMKHIEKLTKGYLSDKVILYTADGWDMHHLACGPLHDRDVLTTLNFGPNSNHKSAFSRLRSFQGHGPLVNSEFYPGWLDHWGEPHQCKTPQFVNKELINMLNSDMGKIFINFYMFFGGTNYGFYNGANMVKEHSYQPDPTSYDYDAPLTECGDLTKKYHAIRNTIKKYRPLLVDESLLPLLSNSTKQKYGIVNFNEVLAYPKIKELATKVIQSSPVLYTFEDLQQDYGFILYELSYDNFDSNAILEVNKIRDMVYVFTDDVFIGQIYRNSPEKSIQLPSFKKLSLMVENMGRINYGPHLHDFKGILGDVKVNKRIVSQENAWNIWTLPLNNTDKAKFTKLINKPGTGSMLRGHFTVKGPVADTWVKMSAFSKGVIFVNGKNIGRYWPAVGPQKHLFVPSVWLHEGENELILFEVENMPDSKLFVELVDYPDIGSC